jgi:hypothetical protein
MAQVVSMFLVWTCLFALVSSTYALATKDYPNDWTVMAKNQMVRVVIYIATLLAAGISLWEISHSYLGMGQVAGANPYGP